MKILFVISFFVFSFSMLDVNAQADSGYFPNVAFPICSAEPFNYTSSPRSIQTINISVLGCNDGVQYEITNPNWYKFTCYNNTPLGFVITPDPRYPREDYDWQLYDVTGKDFQYAFNHPDWVISNNWRGSFGPTGTNEFSTNDFACASNPDDQLSTFSRMPDLIAGHEYLLLVNHFSTTTTGYSLAFTRGRDSIRDLSIPAISVAHPDSCDGKIVRVKFNKKILFNTISRYGGIEFEIVSLSNPSATNPQVVRAENLSRFYDTDTLKLTLSDTLTSGDYQVRIKNGADGNTLSDICGRFIDVGNATANFFVQKKLNPIFGYKINYGCYYDTILLRSLDTTGATNFVWQFDNYDQIIDTTSYRPSIIYSEFGNKNISLTLYNKYGCRPKYSKQINLYNTFKADFSYPSVFCPNDNIQLKDLSIGNNIISWYWNFGNGQTSNDQIPASPNYFTPSKSQKEYIVPIKLVVKNKIDSSIYKTVCTDSAINYIKIVWTCFISVPNAFTPNGDGLNDYLYPLNAYKAKNLKFAVYNRFGQQIFFSSNWQTKWDGSRNGKKMDQGTYVWMLDYDDPITNQHVNTKGTVILIR